MPCRHLGTRHLGSPFLSSVHISLVSLYTNGIERKPREATIFGFSLSSLILAWSCSWSFFNRAERQGWWGFVGGHAER
jgi:hypothetical protein